jgi:ATP phosphoribosyltransferase regulatory subunit
MKPTLLPSGLMDVLPPEAGAEFRLIHHFLRNFSNFGYAPVIPPLAEYESSMLSGAGAATAHHVFRVADPTSSHMLALRADMTGQIARIATTTLKDAPRPLRLCYAGHTLRTTAEALKTRRQHTQVGIERFGDMAAASIAEVLAIACQALSTASPSSLTVDLHYPSAFEALLAEQPVKSHRTLREATRLKDTASLRAAGATTIADILDISGPATSALKRLAALNHAALAPALKDLEQLCHALAHQQVGASVTIDLLDLAGYGYYTGVGYAIYWNAASIEVGRGGCYRTADGEQAIGFTLYLNDLLAEIEPDAPAKLLALALGTPAAKATALQADGYITIYVSEADSTTLKKQGFTHRLHDGKILPI